MIYYYLLYLYRNWFYFTTVISLLLLIWKYRKPIQLSLYGGWMVVRVFVINPFLEKVMRRFDVFLANRMCRREKHKLILRFRYGGRWNEVQLPVGKKRTLLYINNQDDNSVTAQLKDQLGVFNNFFGMHVTPATLGYETLKIKFMGEDEKVYHLDDPIVL